MNHPVTMMIDDVKYVREDSVEKTQINPGKPALEVGAKVGVQTVTYHWVGRVTYIDDKVIVLDDASYVAYWGKFESALKTGNINELERCPVPVTVERQVIAVSFPWTHKLPEKTV